MEYVSNLCIYKVLCTPAANRHQAPHAEKYYIQSLNETKWTILELEKLIIFQVDSVAVCADAGTSYMSDCMELCWSGAKNVDNTNSCSSGMVTKMEICLHIHRVHSESNISEEN